MPDRDRKLLQAELITVAETYVGPVMKLPEKVSVLTVQVDFVDGSDGTDVTLFVQTSLDGGRSWIDIMAFNFTTTAAVVVSSVRESTVVAAAIPAVEAALTDDTILDGILGDRLRVKFVSTGTYSAPTSIEVSAVYG